jgi:hypothetical protein
MKAGISLTFLNLPQIPFSLSDKSNPVCQAVDGFAAVG